MAKPNIREMPNKQPAVRMSAAQAQSVESASATRFNLRLNLQEVQAVAGILLAGLLVRLIFMPATGHETDIGTFESWTLSLIKYGIRGFYQHAGFVDYPPGYIFVLGIFGWIYHFFSGANLPFDLLKICVKAPAIIADLGLAYLSFLIVRRTWSASAALWVAAIVAFNPAVWFLSAYWGQGDSVTAVFLMWAVYFMITQRYELGWLMFGFAVLIKPQPIVVAPLLLVWQIRTSRSWWRLALIPVIGFGIAYLGSVFFGPTSNPVALMAWLYDRYHTGTALYPYNSCNAFNLYSTRLDFWQPDDKLIPNVSNFTGWPQWAWGVAIVAALVLAVALREWRTTSSEYERPERESSFYMALFVALLGFFMFSTRMHERYLFSALALGPLIWNIGPLSRLAYGVLSATFLVNLWYALQYLYNPQADLYPLLVHPLSFLNVLCLFLVAGAYLVPEIGESLDAVLGNLATAFRAHRSVANPNVWEGLVGLTRRDLPFIGGTTAFTTGLLYYRLGRPAERIFDEIYYARAAQEYLHAKAQFEWTHPPLSKLILTIGAWLYHVDPLNVRMLSAFFGVLTALLLYVFAKRLFSSTSAAVTSVVLLLSSGYFYVQSRIATPEVFLAFFALLTLYCGYRFWISAQIVVRPGETVYPDGATATSAKLVFPDGKEVSTNFKLKLDKQTVQYADKAVTIVESDKSLSWKKEGTITGSTAGGPLLDNQRWFYWLLATSAAAGCIVSTKWIGIFDLLAVWGLAVAVSLQRPMPWTIYTKDVPLVRWVWGNAYGFRLPIFVGVSGFIVVGLYMASNIPFFITGNSILNLHGNLHDFFGLQNQMYHYHHDLVATHPYSSKWWTWPLELRPVSYYYHVLAGTTAPNQIVAEVIALPNPAVWLVGVISVPLAGLIAWRERHKGMAFCVAAYFFQWIPWIASPRIDFQYNFYVNLTLICLCSTYCLTKLWNISTGSRTQRIARISVIAYLALCIALFIFFLPVLNATPLQWHQWDARIWYKDGVPHPYGWI